MNHNLLLIGRFAPRLPNPLVLANLSSVSANNNRQPATISHRTFSLSSNRHGWLYDYFTMTEEQYQERKVRRRQERKLRWEKDGPEMPIRTVNPGNLDDPEWYTNDMDYNASPRFGDRKPEYPYFYRQWDTEKDVPFLPRAVHLVVATAMWAWFLYHMYWHHGMFTGEWYAPYLYEFSDEELGIPPDDAPDPEPGQYWGHQGEFLGEYRG